METNESILTREIVSIDDRKRLGKMKDLCVDYDTRAVNYYISSSASTSADMALPFEKALAVGDTFVTVQSRDDFIMSADETKKIVSEGFRLVGAEVFSKLGNRLGVVESYKYDPTYGEVTEISLGKRLTFTADTFVFFAPEFVFVDDGNTTAQEIREGVKPKKKGAKAAAKKAKKAAPKRPAPKAAVESNEPAPLVEEAPAEASPLVIEPEVEAVAVVEEETVVEIKDDDLKEFLVGAVLNEDVKSADGEFKVSAGEKLTEELIDEAQKHDALLLLTMSVEA